MAGIGFTIVRGANTRNDRVTQAANGTYDAATGLIVAFDPAVGPWTTQQALQALDTLKDYILNTKGIFQK